MVRLVLGSTIWYSRPRSGLHGSGYSNHDMVQDLNQAVQTSLDCLVTYLSGGIYVQHSNR